MKNQAIAVTAEGNKLNTSVTSAAGVEVPNALEVEEVIAERINQVTAAISGEGVEDPTIKKCSRCAKMGRIALHPVGQFSTLKTGKLSSQCKVCRTEQSNEWCQRRAEHRRQYHKEYRASRIPQPKVLKEIEKMNADGIIEGMPEDFQGRKGLESLFIAFTANMEDDSL